MQRSKQPQFMQFMLIFMLTCLWRTTLQRANGEPHFPAGRAFQQGQDNHCPRASCKALAPVPELGQCSAWLCFSQALGLGQTALSKTGSIGTPALRQSAAQRRNHLAPTRCYSGLKMGLNFQASGRSPLGQGLHPSAGKPRYHWRSFPCQEWPKGPLVPGAQ